MIYKVIYFSFLVNIIFCQEYPQDFIEYHLKKLRFDIGENWKNNSTLDPIPVFDDDYAKSNDTIRIKFNYGLVTKYSDSDGFGNSINFYAKTFINENLYMYMYPRIVTNANLFERYSGIPRPRKRLGFNSGETDLAGVVFNGNNFQAQISRGRQIWGAGNNIHILLGEKSAPYDYFMLKFFFRNAQFKTFNGFLERKDGYNRYISARAIEWSNKKSVLISLSEVIVYSGINRPMDFSYLNPISSHLEVELNDRQNQLGTSSGNAMWQLSTDILTRSNIRFSGNFIIDELAIDKIERDDGKAHGLGWSFGLNWNMFKKDNYFLIFQSKWYRMGTHVSKHAVGYNNFVHRSLPIGWEIGNDGEQLSIGLILFRPKNLILDVNFNIKSLGQNSISINPYNPNEDYKKTSFPSGLVKETVFFSTKFSYKINNYLRCNLNTEYLLKPDNNFNFNFNFNYFFSQNFNIIN